MKIRFALLAAALLAAPAAAQRSAVVYDSDKERGWKAEADGVSHSSGLKCPSTVWKDLGDAAPVGFDNDSFGNAAVDASCQYYTYWDSTLDTETRLVVNIIKTPDLTAYVQAWGPDMVVFGEPEMAETVRGDATYRMIRWQDDTKHVSTLIFRPGEQQGLIMMVVQPFDYDEEQVWTVVEALYRANS